MQCRQSIPTLLLVLVLLGVLFVQPAYADVLTVTRVDDPTPDGCVSGVDCSLREAILAAEANPGPDEVRFNITGCSGVCLIQPLTPLPTLANGDTTITGYTMAGSSFPTETSPASLMIRIDGALVPSSIDNGFSITSANNTIKGLIITRFSAYGIAIFGTGATDNVVSGNIVGTNGSDASGLGNLGGVGIAEAAHDNIIGGDQYADRNVISGNSANGIDIQPLGGTPAYDNTISGNYIGTNNAGNAARANGISGVQLAYGTYGNIIGGTLTQERNVISGNSSDGIVIWRPLTNANTVIGNYVGTTKSGLAAVPNGANGISIYEESDNNTIGGDDGSERNLISGNSASGVRLYGSGTTGNIVSGNYIGTKSNGTEALANGIYGVIVTESASSNTIGGSTFTSRNVISGNTSSGIYISNSASNNVVSANLIGTSSNGSDPLPNGGDGIMIRAGAVSNTIGGDTGDERNIISANTLNGLVLFGATTTDNSIVGNRIGSTYDGLAALPNDDSGIVIEAGAHGNTIGGDSAADRNLISGNDSIGVLITGAGTNDNQVLGNYIGINASGVLPLPNLSHGVVIQLGAASNTIGPGNLISGNSQDGVYLTDSAASNSVIGNLIGTNYIGTSPVGNSAGVEIDGDAINNVIGGDDPGERNVISGNANGVSIQDTGTTGNRVLGNYIGTNISGDANLSNEYGVFISLGAQNNIIGEAGAGNLISGNQYSGVVLSGSSTSGNSVAANLIGLNASGTAAAQNQLNGIHIIAGANTNTVGGTAVGTRNIIAGNGQHGVLIEGSGTDDNLIIGNYIGTAASGTAAVANSDDGVRLAGGAQGNFIGGDVSAEGNLISGNSGYGVYLTDSGTNLNTFSANFIGVDASGTSPLGNGLGGVSLYSGPQYNTLGGDTVAERNVISGNSATGISLALSGTDHNTISGNFIGLNAAGSGALPNSGDGVLIQLGAQLNTIGGSSAGERNVISGNNNSGIRISDASSNTVLGNYIGMAANGFAPLGNAYDGVRINSGAVNNTIGPGNRIISNIYYGVAVVGATTTGNVITQNQIHSNGLWAIRLFDGSNGGISPAYIGAVSLSPLTITGTACPGCTAEVYANPVNEEEGWIYLGSAVADSGNNWTLSVGAIPAPYLAATATDATYGTSQFSYTVPSTVRSLFLPLIMR